MVSLARTIPFLGRRGARPSIEGVAGRTAICKPFCDFIIQERHLKFCIYHRQRWQIWARQGNSDCYTSAVDLNAILADLRQQHTHVMEAIAAIERLAASSGKRRGRPPAWLAAVRQNPEGEPAKRRGRPPGTRNKPNGE